MEVVGHQQATVVNEEILAVVDELFQIVGLIEESSSSQSIADDQVGLDVLDRLKAFGASEQEIDFGVEIVELFEFPLSLGVMGEFSMLCHPYFQRFRSHSDGAPIRVELGDFEGAQSDPAAQVQDGWSRVAFGEKVLDPFELLGISSCIRAESRRIRQCAEEREPFVVFEGDPSCEGIRQSRPEVGER